MKTKFLIALCFALTLCVEVYGDAGQEVRRGRFPYMAFLYYPDESVVDGTGARFLRGAILIRPDWLVTSAVGPSRNNPDAPNSFPRKTLLARLGAITIDTNFTLNEDEDEQEREVIRIVRPYNSSATQWWSTDISLMKVLLAFNITSAVGFTSLNSKHDIADKTCIILVYAKRNGNVSEDRSLMQISVEMQQPSVDNCGSHFIGNSMTCAADSDGNKNAVYDSNFCQGNSGGPLICENEVVGIQTYIDNNCKQPHLYQLLSGWGQLISCSTEEKCEEKQCSQICDVANKDAPSLSTTGSTEKIKSIFETESIPVPQASSAIPETTTEDSESVTTTSQTPGPDDISTIDSSSLLVPTPTHFPDGETDESKSWPNERKNLEQGETENTERKPNVEAQHHDVHVKKHSSGRSNVSNTLSLFFGLLILACLI